LSVLIKCHQKAGINVPLERNDYVKQGKAEKTRKVLRRAFSIQAYFFQTKGNIYIAWLFLDKPFSVSISLSSFSS
jgi:hypothetical protein